MTSPRRAGRRRRRPGLRRTWRSWRRRHRWLRPLLLGSGALVGLVALVAVLGTVHAVYLEHRLEGLDSQLQVAQGDAENGRIGQAERELTDAASQLASINSTLYDSRDFTLLDEVPVARQNIEAVRNAVGVALRLVDAGLQIVQAGSSLETPAGHLDVSLTGGQIPVGPVQSIQATISSALVNLPLSARPPGGTFVLGTVRRAQDKVYREAASRERELTSIAEGLDLLQAIAGDAHPSRYLIAVANTAEMRGAGGMILSYGTLDADDGRVSMGAFGSVNQLALHHPVSARFPPDFTRTFAAQQPTELWRNATIMSDFTVDAPVLEAMYTQATGLPLDGVFQMDPAGLAAILAATGPVDVPGLGSITSANVVPEVLNQAYVAVPDTATRHDYLTDVARAAFQALTTRTLSSLRPLGTGLVKAAQARHIILSFTDPKVQSTVARLGFDGSLPPPGVTFAQLTIQNFGGDKMDYYLDSSLAITRSPGSQHLVATITLDDAAPARGTPPYIFGPETDTDDPPGTYRGFVTLYLPPFSLLDAATTDATVTRPVPNTQGGNTTVTYDVDIGPGTRSTVTLDVTLPASSRSARQLLIVPSPRINSTVVTIEP